jgi:hypothetical protein
MQIVHALRTGAENMSFGEITEVVPWDVLAHDCGQDLSAPQVAVPRAFKSHATWPNICKGGTYIYVARDPVDAFYSFYKFLPSYTNLQLGDITQDQFADAIFAGASHSGQIWDHFLGWWEQRHNPDVMWLFYEDLKDDLPGVGRGFCLPSPNSSTCRACPPHQHRPTPSIIRILAAELRAPQGGNRNHFLSPSAGSVPKFVA